MLYFVQNLATILTRTVASNLRKLIFILSFLLSWISFSQSENEPSRILTFPEKNYHYRKAKEFTAKKWNIEIHPATNALVTEKAVDSANKVNSDLWKKMDSLYGQNSEERFRKETIAEMKKIIEAQKIFDSDSNIQERILKIKKLKEQTISALESVSADGKIYYWTIYSFEKKNNPNFKWVPEFKVAVHLTEKKTKIISLE